ncbi:hypothetical protein S1OALGB6SA_580 [Olavius algarvensis spirochete endosymbiont]|nr:hypothetical protein S1OALGB6SA_580 [Olavius algarvensis spirochete endosymbiont]
MTIGISLWYFAVPEDERGNLVNAHFGDVGGNLIPRNNRLEGSELRFLITVALACIIRSIFS